MKIFAKAALAAAVALALGACSTSIVVPASSFDPDTGDSGNIALGNTPQIPGFRPTWGEQTANSLLVWSDMKPETEFAAAVCPQKPGQNTDPLTENSIFVLKIGGGSATDSTATKTGGSTGASDSTGSASSSSSSNGSRGGGSHTGGSGAASASSSSSGSNGSSASSAGSGGSGPGNSGTSASASSSGGFTVSLALAGAADSKDSTDGVMVVSKCSLKVIATAVNVCVYKTRNKNVLDKLENFGLYQILAVAGTAATIASLSHSSGGDTAWITGGAAVVTAVAANSQKALPTPTAAQIPGIVNAGLDYMLLDNPMASSDIKASYANLFNASIAQCPLNGS